MGGGEMFLCLDVLVHRDLYHLPEGKSAIYIYRCWSYNLNIIKKLIYFTNSIQKVNHYFHSKSV